MNLILSSMIGAALSAIGGLAAGALGYASSREQRSYDYQMWLKQQEYNKPVNQVKRLQEAGINPALALNQITTGMADSHAGGQQPADFSPISQGFQAAGSLMSQQSLIDAQAREHFANASMAEFNRSAADMRLRMELQQNLLGLQEQRARIADSSASADVKRRRLSAIDVQIEQQKMDLLFSKDTMDDRKRAVMLQNRELSSRIALTEAQTEYQRLVKRFYPAVTSAQLQQIGANISLLQENVKNAIIDGRIKTVQQAREQIQSGIDALSYKSAGLDLEDKAFRFGNRGRSTIAHEVYGMTNYIGDVLIQPFKGLLK